MHGRSFHCVFLSLWLAQDSKTVKGFVGHTLSNLETVD